MSYEESKMTAKKVKVPRHKVYVDNSDYRNSHPEKPSPRGFGMWIFGIGSKNEKDWFTVPLARSFTEAKKVAIAEAKRRGVDTIYTMG